MNRTVKKLLRTMLVNVPFMQEPAYAAKRFLRNGLKVPAESDFNALSLFPDTAENLYLDVGANRGQSADAILMKTKHGRVHLFEPNPFLFRMLERWYGDNGRCELHNFGLGDEAGQFVLHVPFYKRWMFDGFASFDEDTARAWLEKRIYSGEKKNISVKEAKCFIRRLDELGLKPFLIKLDVQGYEPHALRGALDTLETYEPVLLIEHPDRRVLDKLKEFSYHPFAFDNGRFISGRTGRLNSFLMTESKSKLVEGYIDTH
jgi:FkbM family methyltransferase